MKKILVIGAGWEQRALIQTVRDCGHTIIATHPTMQAEGFSLANHYYVKDSRDVAAHLRIAKSHQIDAVITDNCDYSLYTAAIVAAKHKLPFADIQSAIFSNDKLAQRERCTNAKIRQPMYQKVTRPDELPRVAHAIGFPVILKPVDSRGTFGVTIIRSQAQIEDAFYDAVHHSPSRTLICEKFIEGTLVTVDGFCFKNGHRSLAVASRKFEIGARPVTKEIIYPAQFSDSLNQRLLENHTAVANCLGYRYGHTHGEYILTEDEEIYLVECANRGGGVYTSSVIVPLLTRIDLNKVMLNQTLGEDEFEVQNLGLGFMKSSAVLTFLDFEIGKVIKDINIEEMRQKPYTVRFRSIYGENDMVESVDNCASRHSMLVLRGATAREAMENLQQFKKELRVTYHK